MGPQIHYYVFAGGWHPTSISYVNKMFFHLASAVDGHMRNPPLHCHACVQGGLDFRKLGVRLSQSDAVRSWLRLQTNTDCISHPYHMCIHSYACAGGGGF